VKKNSGFGLIVYLVLVVAILGMLGGLWYSFNHWCNAECQNWREEAATASAALADLQAKGDDRAKRAEAVAKKATGELAALRKQLEQERANTEAGITSAWREHLDRLHESARREGADALTACRADAAAARSALDSVVVAALGIHRVATLNTEQLRQLQAWVTEAAK
jgi:hypothetical protein